LKHGSGSKEKYQGTLKTQGFAGEKSDQFLEKAKRDENSRDPESKCGLTQEKTIEKGSGQEENSDLGGPQGPRDRGPQEGE